MKNEISPKNLEVFRGREQLLDFSPYYKCCQWWEKKKSLAETLVPSRLAFPTRPRLLLQILEAGDPHLVPGDEDCSWRWAWSIGDGGTLRGRLGSQKKAGALHSSQRATTRTPF